VAPRTKAAQIAKAAPTVLQFITKGDCHLSVWTLDSPREHQRVPVPAQARHHPTPPVGVDNFTAIRQQLEFRLERLAVKHDRELTCDTRLVVLEPQSTTNSAAFDNSPIGKAFSQLTRDIHSGNLSGARQDYSKIQQDIQSHLAHWHHNHGGPIAGGLLQSQSFSPTSVQQAYSSVQAPVSVSSQSTSSGVSVKA